MPQGLPRRSRLLSMPVASVGNADSTRTWWRRIPLMWSMCSMSTGHSLDAGAAVGARPQRLGVDDPVHVRRRRPAAGPPRRARRPGGAPARPPSREQVGGLGEGVVAQVEDDLLGRQRLVGRPGRALRLAAAALGAGAQVEQALPGHVLDLADAEHVGVRVGLLEVEDLAVRPHRLERAEGVRAAGEHDVQRGQDDVQVLGVGDDDQERQDHAELREEEDDLQDAVDAVAERVQRLADQPTTRTPRRRRWYGNTPVFSCAPR